MLIFSRCFEQEVANRSWLLQSKLQKRLVVSWPAMDSLSVQRFRAPLVACLLAKKPEFNKGFAGWKKPTGSFHCQAHLPSPGSVAKTAGKYG